MRLLAKWTRLREIRDLVNKDIEGPARPRAKWAPALQATVTAHRSPRETLRAAGQLLGDGLKFVFITSVVHIESRISSGWRKATD